MQHIFIGILVGAVQLAVLQTAVAVINFIYYVQLQVHTSKTLEAWEKMLRVFHENKQVFIVMEIHKHFNIPKVHQMLHYIQSIKSHGMDDGYNTESSEWLHIDYAKDAYRASNKKDYLRQMTVWLGRQEAVAQFTAFQDYLTKCELAGQMDVLENGDEESLDGNEAEDEDDVVASTLQLRYTLAVKPGFPSLWIHTHNHFWFPCPRLHLLFINSHPMCLPPSVLYTHAMIISACLSIFRSTWTWLIPIHPKI